MLSKNLYNLSSILSCSYAQLNTISNNFLSLNDNILPQINLKKLFTFKWREKLNSPIEDTIFNYSYNILDENKDFIKVKLNIENSFILKSSKSNIPSYSIDEYLIIIEHLNNKFKVQFLIQKEENPFLYKTSLNCDLAEINTLLSYESENIWTNKLDNIDSLYENFRTYTSHSDYKIINRNYSKFDVLAACDYAEKFALTSNPSYKTFEGNGGDCTNFVSQILHAGGINLNDTWKPYSHPWIRVEDLYWYLTFQGIGIKISEGYPLSKGYIIQFYTPKLGRYFHTGFITHELSDGDYLYCCHSYNKLNYPLSAIYPIIYPKLRAIKIK